MVEETQIKNLDPNKGKLLSVVFFKKREHKIDSTPIYDRDFAKLPR